MAGKRVKKDNTLEVITHVISIFSSVIGALLIFLLTKDRGVKKHARNALNWQISLLIYMVILLTVSSIFSLITSTFPKNGIFVPPFSLAFTLLNIVNIIFCLIASFKAYEGQLWKYPLSFNFVDKVKEKDINKGKKEIKKAYKEVKRELKK